MTDELDAAAVAAAISPRFGAGIRSIYRVLEADGALLGMDKALFTAAAACTQYLPDLTRAALGRARDRGLPASAAVGTALLVMLFRGETAFRDFVGAVRAVYGDDAVPHDASGAEEVATTTEEALAYFERHFGEVPPRQRLFSELSPGAFQGYQLMHQAGLKENVLSHKQAELLLCAVIAAEYQPTLLEIHIRSALAVGATHAEVAEAVLAAVPAAGLTVWSSGAAAIANTRPAAVADEG